MRRVNGQIWIDKKPPYRLKYHYNGVDYIVEVAATYDPAGVDEDKIPAGTVVKLKEGTSNTIAPAVFPDDLNSVIGVTINDAIVGDPDMGKSAVAQSGYIILTGKEAIEYSFPLATDRNTKTNFWNDKAKETTQGIGAPIYWFIGGTFKEDGIYKHIDSTEEGYQGRMTFRTPSGYKWRVNTVEDTTLNIGYDNLPLLGTVAGYKVDNDSNITELYIHLNFSKFDSSLEWNWPYLHEGPEENPQGCGKLTEGEHAFRHGLFANNKYYSELASFINVVTSEDTISGSVNAVETTNKNVITGTDRKTIVTLYTPEDSMLYRISGEVHYKFDKHKEIN